MVKKLLLFSTLLLITIIPNINVNAISFNTNAYSCVYFTNGANAFCTNVVQFTYDTVPYYGADYSYNPDYLDVTGETVLDFKNQSFCSDQSTGGTFKFRLYHNYDFESNPLDYLYLRDSKNGQTFCSSTYVRSGRYSEVSCTLPLSLSNTTLTVAYHLNDLPSNFPFTAGVSNISSESCGFSSSDIINNNNQNTNSIINNNTNNTNQIIQNNEQNTQDIINNQNQNTQQEIESQKVCSIIDKSSIITKNVFLEDSGSTSTSSSFGITDYIKVYNSDLKKLNTVGNSPSICFYTESKTLISCIQNRNLPIGEVDLPTNSYYIRASINYNTNAPQYELCSNGNQALTDALTSEDSPNTNQDIEDMNDMVASDTPITDLLTLPMTLINAYYTGISSSCSPYNFGSLLGTDIIFPCIDLEQRLGSNLWLIIDSLCSIFLIYSIAMLFVHAFDSLTSLKDDFDDMYVPRHAGKHVGSGING